MELVRSTILENLQEIHEDVDFEKQKNLLGDDILDSFDMMTLASEISEEFDIDITAKDFTEEHFQSLDALTEMVVSRMKE